MTILPTKSNKQNAESWLFYYVFFFGSLAMMPLLLAFTDLAWPYKIAFFYVGFLLSAWISLLSPSGQRVLQSLRRGLAISAIKFAALL